MDVRRKVSGGIRKPEKACYVIKLNLIFQRKYCKVAHLI